MNIDRRRIGPRMSQITIYNGVVYLAGQVASDPAASLADQARQTLAAVDALLAEAGTDKSRLLSVTVYLESIGDFAGFNEVYDMWVDKENPPVRACVEARLAAPGYRCEVCAIAATK
jgi:enamine deaminase RidA (YjgF/YER057c/UK114 family)